MTKTRCFYLACLALFLVFAQVTPAQEATPAPQIQMDVVIGSIQVPKVEEKQVLKTLLASQDKTQKSTLTQHGWAVWTPKEKAGTYEGLQRLRARGFAKLLACPKIVATSGQEATFLSGGEVPIPNPAPASGEVQLVKFEEYGIKFHFVPTVLPSGKIHLVMKYRHSQAVTNSPLFLTEKGCLITSEVSAGETLFFLMADTGTSGKAGTRSYQLMMITPYLAGQ